MNFLAHAYLSFNDTDLLTGNMISDFVKGRQQYNYPREILAGIRLHRAIDEFTDSHESTRGIKELFRPAYRLYSGAMADVVYDHFLANDPNEFPSLSSLEKFTLETYARLESRADLFPLKFAGMFPYMRRDNWLYHYHTDEGMRKSFGGLGRRAQYITETDTAFRIFKEHKKMIGECYDTFFPAVKAFAFNQAKR